MTLFRSSRFQFRLRTALILFLIAGGFLAPFVTAYRHSTTPLFESMQQTPTERQPSDPPPEPRPAQLVMLPDSVDGDLEWDQRCAPGNLLPTSIETGSIVFSGRSWSTIFGEWGHDPNSLTRTTPLGHDEWLVEYTGPRLPPGPPVLGPHDPWRLELTPLHLAE